MTTTAPTFTARDDSTIQVHAPGFDVLDTGMASYVLFLDKERRVALGWIDFLDNGPADTYLIRVNPGQADVCLGTYAESLFGDDPEFVDVPGVSYLAPDDATAEQVAEGLTKYAAAALEWVGQGYPVPAAA